MLTIPFLKIVDKGSNNIAFAALLQLGATEEAIDLLIKTDRIPEAAMFARTYLPDQISRVVKLWKMDLEKNGRTKVAQSLADPESYPNLFPELQTSNGTYTEEEQTFLQQQAVDLDAAVPAEQDDGVPVLPEVPQEEDLLQPQEEDLLQLEDD